MPSASEKRKLLVQRIRYGALVLFTSLIIISFVVSLAYNPFSSQERMRSKLVKVNGKWFYEGVDTGFGYWYDEQKNRLQQQGVSFSDKEIEQLFYEESIKNYAKTLSVVAYTKGLGIRPSDFFYKQLAQALYRTEKPTFGEREYLDIFYIRDIFLGNWGDIQNTLLLSPSSLALLYQDSQNLAYDVEIVYTEKTNFVARFVEKADLETYYQQNVTNFLDTVIVDRISLTNKNVVSNRVLAEHILSNVQSMGWEKAVATLPPEAVVTKDVTITRERYPRVFESLQMVTSSMVLPRPLFENKQYHVIRIQKTPSFEGLSAFAQQRLLKSYLALHFDALWAKYASQLTQTLASLQANPSGDWKTMVSNKPFGYVRLPKLSLVDVYAQDSEGSVFPYQLSQHPEVLSFLVSSAASVKQFEFGGVYLLLRKNGISRTQVKPQTAMTSEAYYYIMNAWNQDWQKMVETKTKIAYRKDKK
ncbi:MAG: hypothetical protein N2314_00380 [Brevinematales bacterium]|nr:hypothetical protein [Brevinematales bacterium]